MQVNMMTIVKDSSYSAGRNLGTNVWKGAVYHCRTGGHRRTDKPQSFA